MTNPQGVSAMSETAIEPSLPLEEVGQRDSGESSAAEPNSAAKRAPLEGHVLPGEPLWFPKYRLVERHLGTIAAFVFAPLNWKLFALFCASYVMRMWGAEVVYHRYFAHRSYSLGRATQFIFALIGTQSGQRGPLWWAAMHRRHHQFADQANDPHSPTSGSFWHAHARWTLEPDNFPTDLRRVPDFSSFPELRWLNRFAWVPVYALGAAIYFAGNLGWFGEIGGGLQALGWGFFVPSLLAAHATGLVNSLGHARHLPGGFRRFSTKDSSMNRPLVALLTMGAGWHNNHHYFASAARAGFAWYEIDFGYYSLKLLERLGVVSRVKGKIPEQVLRAGGL